jgi:DNA processing protein
MGPARLLAVVRAFGAEEGWARVSEGRALGDPGVGAACGADPGAVAAAWVGAARQVEPDDVAVAYAEAGIGVVVLGDPAYPSALASDHEAPGVLFVDGDLEVLEVPSVAIVGTRRCTRYGYDVARRLGAELADAGVGVVSGLAVGIDAAAHEGALSVAPTGAPPAAVVGSGLDVIYPRGNRRLWVRVARGGVVLSEAPLGAAPEQWRFPARNRIIAALARAVVVVESHRAGGSMHTVDAADVRSRPVLAVPGPVVSPASAGTNRLIADGCAPVLDVDDVLVALGLEAAGGAGSAAGPAADTRPRPEGDTATVLDAMGFAPASLDQLVVRSGLRPSAVALALARLEETGWVVATGGWWERRA